MAKRILVVDDAAFMRMTLSDMLTKNGFEVVGEAVDGDDAVKKYEAHLPDAVTMDITMPNVNGIEAVKRIKGKWPDAVVLMVSAMGQKDMVVEAIQSGASDFIVKPFKADRVVEALSRALGQSAQSV